MRSNSANSAPSSAKFVWSDPPGRARNAFAVFRRAFDLSRVPREALLHLFADSRYRVRVNGVFAGSGPARFVTAHPEYDSLDIAGLLRAGMNVIEAEVNFCGASTFQTMPDGSPGFIAWGGAEGVSFETPGEWRVAAAAAWRSDSPVFSFAQGPVEICDTRVLDLPASAFVSPAVLPAAECPWGPLAPYSGRPVRSEMLSPARIEAAGELQAPARIVAAMARGLTERHSRREGHKAPVCAAAVWILSPRPQTVRISCFWSDLLLNGVPVQAVKDAKDSVRGNHQSAVLSLREGWNLLTAKFEALAEYWAFMLGFPAEAGLSLHGLPDRFCRQPLAVYNGGPGVPLRLPQPGDTALPEGWELSDGAPPNLTPARVCGWDALAEGACRNLPAARLAEMSPVHARGAVWCLRFEGEFLGHPVIEAEGPEGAVLDVTCDDWQTSDGTAALYKSNPFTDSTDRFILRGGRQTVELFNVRGGKFLQVTLRAPGAAAPLSLHRVVVRSRQTTGPSAASFRSGHEVLDWAFGRAVKTLSVSTSSSYTDCPWRERGMYLGDALVSMHIDLIAFGDPRTARRMLRVFAQAKREDGLLPACAPAWLRYSFADYTLLWILALRDFWALTGERSLVEELWPVLLGIWESPAWQQGGDGLWTARPGELFVDWGVLQSERLGEANAVLNTLRVAALRASAELAAALGSPRETRFRSEAADVEEKLLRALWIEHEGRLAPSRGETTPALHGNILALFCETGPPSARASILRYLEPLLAGNFAQGISKGQFSGHAELYFFYFLLPALAAHGRPDLAERLITDHYGYLRSLGDDTLPECFCRVHHAVGSRCHSWSGAPAIYAARHVLGVRPAQPGDPSKFVCEPVVHSIRAASGRIAHPAGWIDISWERREDGALDLRWAAPEGVELAESAAAGFAGRQAPGAGRPV